LKHFTKLAFALLLAVPAFCDNIPGIPYSTGVLDDGTLAPQGTVDLHYVDVTSGTPQPVYIESRGFNYYGTAQPDGPAASGNGTGSFIYQTTFTLTGYDPSTVTLAGFWASDDGSSQMTLNGNTLSVSNVGCCGTVDFTIDSGFVNGLNTLDFYWSNYSDPGDLGVGFTSFTGTPLPADAAAPEPATLALFGVSGVGLLLASRLTQS